MGKIVALVPARAGSTRIKNKNIRQIKGIPLIGIAVKQAIDVKEIDEVYVSTDSELYAQIAQAYGAVKPFLRPLEISGNLSTDYDVFQHFLEWYQKSFWELPEMIVQIRPTAPARTVSTISEAIRFMKEHPEFDSLRSISIPHQTPYKMWTMKENQELIPLIKTGEQTYDLPTQNLPKCFGQDGIVDIVRPETLLKYKNMAGEKIAGISEHPKTWDIDTDEDLRKAGEILKTFGIFKLPIREKGLGGCLGIIQGRLTVAKELQYFPDNWYSEFPVVRKLGYTTIECFRDKVFNEKNPLWSGNLDMEEIKQAAFAEGIGIRSICDDFIQQCEWKNLSIEQYLTMEALLLRAAALGTDIIVYPMFEKADLSIQGNYENFLEYIHQVGKLAERLNIRIALEISEDHDRLVQIFEGISSSNIGICVDTGNLYASGISVNDILRDKRLRKRIFHIHLKDRNEHGMNVVPGNGKVNFLSIFEDLYRIDYDGLLITETDRGFDPQETARQNKVYFQNIVKNIIN